MSCHSVIYNIAWLQFCSSRKLYRWQKHNFNHQSVTVILNYQHSSIYRWFWNITDNIAHKIEIMQNSVQNILMGYALFDNILGWFDLNFICNIPFTFYLGVCYLRLDFESMDINGLTNSIEWSSTDGTGSYSACVDKFTITVRFSYTLCKTN